MKKITLAIFLLLSSANVFAWTIGPMNYQGRLLDSAGVPVSATLPFKVRIYDAASGGTLKFSEQHNSVAVDDGVYSFLVSTGTSPTGTWDINLWNTATLYLEIEANGETLTPRHLLASTPFAFQANLALTTNNALALGGKSAAEYNSVLASICTSSKGKWLEIVGKCLGIGAAFPGPSVVNLNTLTASTDLSGLDLTKADVSGINFGNANMSGTIFKNTTIKPTGLTSVNLTGAVLDGVITSGSATFTANFANATIKNMSLSGWSMSGANFTGLSVAYISACPTSMPTQWTCKQQHSPSDGKYFLVGPYANLSSTSALAVEKTNGKYLDFHESALSASDVYLASAQMTGVIVTQTIIFKTMAGINFSNSTFLGAYLDAYSANAYSMQGIDFSNSTWENSFLYLKETDPSDGLNFTNAQFRNSRVRLPIINLTPQYTFLGFSGAIFENTTITGAGGGVLPMYSVTFDNVVLDVATQRLELIDCKIYGGFAVDNPHNFGGTSLMETSYITQARLTGRFDNWSFNENIFYHAQLDGNFSETIWSSNEINNTVMGHTLYNATFASNGNYPVGYVRWYGTCPDDEMGTTEGTPTNNYYCDVTW